MANDETFLIFNSGNVFLKSGRLLWWEFEKVGATCRFAKKKKNILLFHTAGECVYSGKNAAL